MTTTLLLAFLQIANQGQVLTVRNGEHRVEVPVVTTPSGALLPADRLLGSIGARMTRKEPDGLAIEVGGATVEFTLGLPFARIGWQTAPASPGPLVRDGEVLLPISFATEILPRYVRGFTWDSARSAVLVASASKPGVGVPARTADKPAAATTASASPRPNRKPLVVVDAGHGGPDRGMRGVTSSRKEVHEADIALAIARRLRESLSARGVDVEMTRNRDTLIALADRGRIANEKGATLFLSIHVNAANPRWKNPRTARGFETYFLSDAKTEDERRVAAMENEADRFLDIAARPGDPLSFLLSDMRQNEYLRESSELAEWVQSGMKPVHPSRADRGVKQAGFAVLVAAHMPAVLVEVGFGTNPAEASWLSSAKGQQQLADAIAESTTKYLGEYARRGGASLVGR